MTPALCFLAALALAPPAAEWPRFRGPNGSGVAEGDVELPVSFGPGENLAWSAPVPPGTSSPVVAGDRIYITALREKTLLTLAIERSSGKVLWERPAPAREIEEVHSTSSPAASTPTTDGERVVAFFGSFGFLCYDPEGKELWRLPLGPFKNPFGLASSPVIAGDLVLLNCDQDLGSFLIAMDKASGKERWRADRPEFPRGYSTPILWEEGGEKQVVVAGTLKVKGYRLGDGKELWSQDGLARIVNPTPILGDGLLYVASFSPGGDAGERISMPLFDEYAAANDADKNGRFTLEEVTQADMKNRFRQIDADKDGFITRAEWDGMARIFEQAKNSILAFKPESPGKAGVTLAWHHDRAIPYVPTPLYYRGHVYMVKDGGIFTALDARSGKAARQGRLEAQGGYYSSPVAAGGRIYLASLEGKLTAVSAAGERWEVLATSSLGERCAATPAIARGVLYVRTERRLLAFGKPGEKASGPASR